MKAHVLFVGPYPPPYGGIASLFVSILDDLVEEGYKVTFLSLGVDEKEEKLNESVTVIRSNLRDQVSKTKNLLGLARNSMAIKELTSLGASAKESVSIVAKYLMVESLVKERNVDIVCTYMIKDSFFVPLLRKSLGEDFPIVQTVFAELYEAASLYKGKEELARRALESTSQLMATSRFCGDSIRLLGMDSSDVEVVYIGVDLEKFHPERSGSEPRAKLGLGPEDQVALFLARLSPDMGTDVIVDIVPELLEKHPRLKFLVVGASGSDSDAVKACAAASNGRVIVRENADFADIPDFYAASDLLLAPTKDNHPCMGVSIKEAMASGLPVISTKTGGIPEAIQDAETGYLIDIDENGRASRDQVIARIEELLENPELRGELGTRGRKRAEELFSCRACAEKHFRIFEQLMSC